MNNTLLRAFVYLEDGNFEEARRYAKEILQADSRNAEAYLVLLMARLGVRERTGLGTLGKTFDNCDEYHQIMRLDDRGLQDELESYLGQIQRKQKADLKEQEEREQIVKSAREKENAKRQYETLKREIDNINMRSTGVDQIRKYKNQLESIKKYVNVDELLKKVEGMAPRVEKVHRQNVRRMEISGVIESILTFFAWIAPVGLGLGGFIIGRFVLGSFLIGCFIGMFGGCVGFCIWMKEW